MAFSILSGKANDSQTVTNANVVFAMPANAPTGATAFFAFNSNSAAATLTVVPSGCDLVRGPDGTSNANNEMWTYKKTLPGTIGSNSTDAGTNITFTLSAALRCCGVVAIVSGQDSGLQYETTNSNSSAVTNTVITAASVTTARRGLLVLEFHSGRTATTINTAPTLSAALTHLDFASTAYAGAVNLSMECAYRTALTTNPGSYGGDTSTYTNTNTTQVTSVVAVVPFPAAALNNYEFADVGDGMSTTEKIR